MTNAEIICNEAIASGFYTQEEIEELLSEGLMPEMHTFIMMTGLLASYLLIKSKPSKSF